MCFIAALRGAARQERFGLGHIPDSPDTAVRNLTPQGVNERSSIV